jgi:hypothetical protein
MLYKNDPVYGVQFDGEIDNGEMGPLLKYAPDHDRLRIRAWQMDIEDNVSHTAIKQKVRWTLGANGLKLNCAPNMEVLGMYGIKFDPEDFNKRIESLWEVCSASKMMDYKNSMSLHKLAKKTMKNAEMGDCLVVQRVVNGMPKVQIIDGAHVQTPIGLSTMQAPSAKMVDNYIGLDYVNLENGNRVRWGVEIDDTGEHVAYWVRTAVTLNYTRIPARTGMHKMLTAFMVYGSDYRLDDTRGIPSITPIMQGAKQRSDYSKAMVGSAVEAAKMVFQVVHGKHSDGTNPLGDAVALAETLGGSVDRLGIPQDLDGRNLASTVAATTGKQTFNNTPDSEIKILTSDKELYYKEFNDSISDQQYSTIGIPPEVATQKYGGSYSGSRAAIKSHEISLQIDRRDFAESFYQNIYEFWLYCMVLGGKISINGYLEAIIKDNEIVLSAYNIARWTGVNVPHIDPKKEADAIRTLMGGGSEHFAIINGQEAREMAVNSGGDFTATQQQYAKELDLCESLGIEEVEVKGETILGDEPETTDAKTKKPPKKAAPKK